MLKPGITKYVLIIFLLLPAIAFPQTQEIKEYKVVKGDTLWDISKKELNDPFLWPKVWKENAWIKNPDRLYPGQIIKIPLYLIQQEVPEGKAAPEAVAVSPIKPAQPHEEQKAAPPALRPLVDENLLIASGYIGDTIPKVGTVADSPSGRILFGNNDIVYISVDHPVKVGDRFYVIKASGPVRHPITGKKMGYVITIDGIAEITKIENGDTLAKITKCFGDIHAGDFLDTYYEIEPPMTHGKFRQPDLNGMVVASNTGEPLQSKLGVIYIDRGCEDGVEVGDMFRTLAVERHAVPTGVIQVISCRNHTATAVIESNSAPVVPGNIFAGLREE